MSFNGEPAIGQLAGILTYKPTDERPFRECLYTGEFRTLQRDKRSAERPLITLT